MELKKMREMTEVELNTELDKMKKELTAATTNGAYPNTEFEVCNIKEYTVSETPVSDNGFDVPETDSFFN